MDSILLKKKIEELTRDIAPSLPVPKTSFDCFARVPDLPSLGPSRSPAAALKAERVPDQPILRSLQQLHLHQPLSKYRVTRFVEARLAELAPDAPPPATLAALEAQSEAADSNLLYLIAEVRVDAMTATPPPTRTDFVSTGSG